MARTVTGSVLRPDGTAWYPGDVLFSLVEAFETSTTVYPAHRHTEALDAAGAFTVDLAVPDGGATAHYQIHTPDGLIYDVYLAAGAATDLQTLLTIAGTAVDQDDLQTLLDAYAVLAVRNVAVTGPILAADEYVRATGNITLTLPAATGSRAVYLVKNVGAGVVTLEGNGADTIDGALNQTLTALSQHAVLDAAAGVWDII